MNKTKLKNVNSKLSDIDIRLTKLESLSVLNTLKSIYNKYSSYNYIDESLDGYHIKTINEFNEANGGICWDFVGPIANDLYKLGISYKCYFTGLHKDGEMIASHTYVITETSPKYWIECAWIPHSGLHKDVSYKYVENLLASEYDADEAHTLTYNPYKVYGYTVKQFFDYLEDNAIELS